MSLDHLSRIPIVFLMGEFLKNSFKFQNLADNSTLSQIEIFESTQYYKAILQSFIKIIVSCLIFFSLSCLFVLPVRFLWLVYVHVASVCIGFISYWLSIQTLKDVYELENGHYLYLLCRNLILQCCLSLIFDYLKDLTTNQPIHKAFSFIFTIPTLSIAFLPGTWIHGFWNTVTVLSTLLPLFIMLKILWLNLFTITNLIRNGYNHIQETINNHGISALVGVERTRFEIPCVLRMFWAIRVLGKILYLIIDMEIQNKTLFEVVKYLFIKGCNTLTVNLGMIYLVFYFVCYIGQLFFPRALANDEQNISIRLRRAENKVDSLLDATSIQLSELDDTCAICFQRMVSGKVTRCNHYFHRTCLLQNVLLNINQNKCPLCRCNNMFGPENM